MSEPRVTTESGRVVIVTRYDGIVHARNLNTDYGKPVTVYADSRQEAVNKAIAIGWGGHPSDGRVTFKSVTQEPVVIPPAPVTSPAGRDR